MTYMIATNLENRNGKLFFARTDTAELIRAFGSPLYVMDEGRIRANMRIYRDSMAAGFGGGAMPLYASKALSFKRIYEIAREEGIGIDVVSQGEIHTAERAGFPMEKAYFHSNNKTDEDIAYAMDKGVGYFVADCGEEVDAVEKEAARRGMRQKILLRLTPGIDPHTYEAVSTGKVDSKFGSAIETGQAEAITEKALGCPHIELAGFHCHVGSQVFVSDVYMRAARVMLTFIKNMKDRHGYAASELDLGGGYGVRYTEADPVIDIAKQIGSLSAFMKELCGELGIALPSVRLEPGRSIVADAGLTLYRVGSVKRIPGYKNYVSVDGGMTDNPRYALYRSRYTVLAAEKLDEKETFVCSVVGRCCESGDIIQENVSLPASIARNDILAVLTTGAYNYAMASNYNRICRLPVVMIKDGSPYVAVRRETPDDLIRNDL